MTAPAIDDFGDIDTIDQLLERDLSNEPWVPKDDPDGVWARAAAAAKRAREEGAANWDAEPERDVKPGEEPDDSGWGRIDLRPHLEGTAAEIEPVALSRTDGVKLLYADRLHWLSGEPESLKSWLAQVAVAQALRDGMVVLYVDFETDAADIVARLRALGATDRAILERLSYYRPQAPMTSTVVDNVVAHAADANVALTVIDGCQAAMGASGLDSNNARDFYQWWNRLGRRLQTETHGPMVVIDHVVKNPENRGQYAAGTGQKLAAVDVHIGLELVRPFGHGLTGEARIVIHKDRPGRLRPVAKGKLLGRLSLVSNPTSGAVTHAIEPPTEDGDAKFRPTGLMERVSRYVEDAQTPPTKRKIRTEVRGMETWVVVAADRLVEEGYLAIDAGGRYPVYRSVRPFRENSQATQAEIEI
jgi:hypothetical protein